MAAHCEIGAVLKEPKMTSFTKSPTECNTQEVLSISLNRIIGRVADAAPCWLWRGQHTPPDHLWECRVSLSGALSWKNAI